jgi:hypothetical protein
VQPLVDKLLQHDVTRQKIAQFAKVEGLIGMNGAKTGM